MRLYSKLTCDGDSVPRAEDRTAGTYEQKGRDLTFTADSSELTSFSKGRLDGERLLVTAARPGLELDLVFGYLPR